MRLLSSLLVVSMMSMHAAAQQAAAPIESHLSQAKLAAMPGAPSCFVMAPVEGDPSKEASIIEMKGTAGCSVPLHWHPARERIMMVSGTAHSQVRNKQTEALKSGDYLSVPPRTPMTFRCDTACTLFVHTDGPFVMHYVDESGKEITPEEALKAAPAKKVKK